MVALSNVVAERKAGYGVPDGLAGDDLPFSCSTNLSNDVIEHIGRLGPGPLALLFLTRMHRKTFGDAGDHRKNHESFLSCTFDLAVWGAALGCNRSNLLKTRAHLEESHVIFFEPSDVPGSGQGKLTWNIQFEEWSYYHRRVAKRQQASLVQFRIAKTQLNTLDSATPYSETELSMAGTNTITELKLPGVAICNRTKDACFEGPSGQAPDAPKKSYEKKDNEEESANADALALPDASPLPDASAQVSSSSPETPQQAAMFAGEATQKPAAKPPASRKKAASKTGVVQEQIDALWEAWEPCGPRVIQRRNIGKSEWGRHVKAMTDLVVSGITPEMIPALVAAKHEQWKWKREPYVLKPGDISSDLATLRPMANGEVVATAASNVYSPKGANHAGLRRHTGEWTGNHGRDADLVKRC